jgi:hypothetical protein
MLGCLTPTPTPFIFEIGGMERLKVRARGQVLVVANPDRLRPAERARLVPAAQALAELESLTESALGTIVSCFAWRFPNDHEPRLSERVNQYVRDRILTGSLLVAVEPRGIQ